MSDTSRSTRRGPAAVAGLVAAASALAVAEAAAVALSRPTSTPLLAVGDTVVDLTPLPVKQFAVDTFGTADKPALLIGTAVLLALAAALVGAAAGRRRTVGLVGIAVFAAVGLASVLTRPGNGPLDALPTLAGAAACAGVLLWLLGAASERGGSPRAADGADPSPTPSTGDREDAPAGFDRRRFALLAGAAAAASAGTGIGARLLTTSAPAAGLTPGNAVLPRPGDRAAPLPDGADLELDGLAPFFTPNADFYRIDTALSVPRVDASTWSLRVHGLGVGRERVITYAELLDRPDLRERDITLACVSNPVGGSYIGNARWIGVPLASLLAESGVRSPADGGPADQLISRSQDGMAIGTPVADVMDGREAMLAVGMNGRPLPYEHGFPVRMVVPGLYGYVSACKWITEIELTTFDAFDAYWVPRGWSARGPVKTQSRVDTPRDGADLGRGRTTVAGVAWAQHTGVDRVEVSVDGGPWTEARLAEEDTVDTWRQWVLDWDAGPGEHRIAVRATDRDGHTQTSDQAPPAPDGATGHHTVTVTVA
ncbi:DMSO/TMAO reductase YedYZ molybdopterin-dependent catalytic subunit [Nocardiopsis arvandica]|uniref:DMSO/TMAO reductase YedYZ molybdopterin-dependent catalytic subunit n=1 Tax=Nocardiopsis sinuspersici TaxID=501010 RepID=A0A7Y9XBD7_9ACTN|nr:molybdopterin-dependent oxidoreductase [Nocardiopsis sinuspersici]NYH52659.1 DMSO/TMAO reductase YedYZ molybdopterin-dependent catalytic subunit [Nocardiopsis sinuspersici]